MVNGLLKELRDRYELVYIKCKNKLTFNDTDEVIERWQKLGMLDDIVSQDTIYKIALSFEMSACSLIKKEFTFDSEEIEDETSMLVFPIIRRAVEMIDDFIYPTDVIPEISDFITKIGTEKLKEIHNETKSDSFDFEAEICNYISLSIVSRLIKDGKYKLVKTEEN